MDKVLAFGKLLTKRIIQVDLFGLSAQLAYFFLLSLFPFLIFLFSLLGYFPVDEQALLEFIAIYAPADIMDLLSSNVSQIVNKPSSGLLSVGAIGTLWSASNGVNAITRAFNRAYEVGENRSFLKSRLIAIALTIAMVLVICIALLLPVFGKMIGEYLFSLFGLSGFISVWNSLRWIISSVFLFIVLLALYKLAPHIVIRLRDALWGAIFATVAWQFVSLVFSFYVSTIGNYSATYGSLGAVIMLMIWFYLSGIIIIGGGIMNAMIHKIRTDKMIN